MANSFVAEMEGGIMRKILFSGEYLWHPYKISSLKPV